MSESETLRIAHCDWDGGWMRYDERLQRLVCTVVGCLDYQPHVPILPPVPPVTPPADALPFESAKESV